MTKQKALWATFGQKWKDRRVLLFLNKSIRRFANRNRNRIGNLQIEFTVYPTDGGNGIKISRPGYKITEVPPAEPEWLWDDDDRLEDDFVERDLYNPWDKPMRDYWSSDDYPLEEFDYHDESKR